LINQGNVPESVTVTVADSTRLAGLGWSAAVYQATAQLRGPASLGPGANESFSVHMAAPSGHSLPPGTVTVFAAVFNASTPAQATNTLSVPHLLVADNSTALIVTGPGLGSPPTFPDWLDPILAFLPAAAFLAIVVTLRWYRTRRWVRR